MSGMRDPALQELLDKQALYELVARYCRAVDRVDEELLRSVYWEDAIDEHGPFVGTVDEFVEEHRNGGSWSGRKLEEPVQHAITNTLFDVRGDVAYGETYVEVRRVRDGGVFIEGIARQVDRFERRGGEWRIAHRRILLDYAGPGRDFTKFLHGARDRSDASYERHPESGTTLLPPAL